jgi:hypothetical protein
VVVLITWFQSMNMQTILIFFGTEHLQKCRRERVQNFDTGGSKTRMLQMVFLVIISGDGKHIKVKKR